MRLFTTCLLLLPACLGVVTARSLTGSPGMASSRLRSTAPSGWGRVPLHFEENRGQVSEAVDFLSRGSGYLVGLSATEATLVLSRGHDSASPVRGAASPAPATVGLRLIGADRKATGTALQPLPGKVNYFLGNDPRQWRTDVPTFGQVQYASVYPGIDLVYYGNQQQLEYDFVVRPGADPDQIQFRLGAGQRPALSAEGELLIPCGSGVVRQKRPVIYQEQHGRRRPVSGSYRVAQNGIVGFDLGSYDPRLPLVIDPVLTYASYLGGSQADEALTVAVDADGSCYLGGYTLSMDFPSWHGVQPEPRGSADAFLVKLDPTGTTLEYATFLGGYQGETISALTVAVDETVYLAGQTSSPDFPVVAPFQPAFQGMTDGFVARLGAEGNTLAYATYLGGGDLDVAADVAVDGAGNAYVAGYTQSVDFPTQNPFIIPQSYAGRGFLSKLNPQGSALVYSSQLGGATGANVHAVAVDAAGNAYVGGGAGPDFPWVNPIMTPDSPGATAYVAKVNPEGSGFGYATPILASDRVRDLKVDAGGSVYCVGSSGLSGQATSNAVQTVLRGHRDGFVFRLNAAGTNVVFATYLGGAEDEELFSLDLDLAGNAYVTGRSNSDNFPLASPLQSEFGGGYDGDVVVAKLNATGTSLLYSTYLGAAGNEAGWGIAVDANENAYVVGSTSSFAFPTVRAFQPAFHFGSSDALVFKLGVMFPPDAPTAFSAMATGQTTVRLDWSDASSNESAFEIERKTGTAAAPGLFSRIAQTAAGQTQLLDTGLSPETTYTYRIRAVNAGGPSAYSGPATVTTLPPPPAPPTNLAAEVVSQTRIDLHWMDASDNETHFELERRQAGDYSPLVTLGAGNTTFSDTTLEPDTTYSYRVRAVNLGGASSYSQAAATTLPVPPEAPSELSVTAVSSTQLELHWTDNSSNEAWFEVELRKPDGSYQLTAPTLANAVSVLVGGIRGNGTRAYRVRAVNAGGASGYSNIASGLTLPEAPRDLAVSRVSQTRLDLRWDDWNEAPAAVQLQRRLTAGGKFDFSVTVAAGVTTYTDLALAPDTEYTYRLRGLNASGTSQGFSEGSNRTLPEPPLAPSALTVSVESTTQLRLQWTDNSSNETKFEVYRRHGSGEFIQIATLGAGANSYLDGGLASNTAMTYRVRAANEGGASDYTALQTGFTRPVPPAGLTLQLIKRGGVQVNWTDPNLAAAAHRVERRPEGGTYVPLATVAAGTSTYLDSTASPSGIYFYRVWATNPSGDADSAPEAQVSLPGGKLQVPATINFGKVKLGTSATRPLTLKNQSRTESLRVTVGQTTAPYQRSVSGTVTLAPGEKQVVLLVFQPSVRGQAKGTLEITCSDAAKPSLRVKLTGAGK